MARNKVLTDQEMFSYRIRGVFNAIGDVEVMTDSYIQNYARRVHRPDYGEVAVIETALRDNGKGNPGQVVSVIVFVDIWSWHMYAMKNLDIYYRGEGHMLGPLVN